MIHITYINVADEQDIYSGDTAMSQKEDHGVLVARSTFWLSIGSGFATFISAIATIVIARLLEPTDYGIYQAALLPITIISVVSDLGSGMAATHYIAYNRRRNEEYGPYIKATLLLSFTAGVALAALLLLISPVLSEIIFRKPELSYLISLTSIMVFSSAINNASRGIFLGIEQAEYIAILLMIFSLVRNLISVILVILGFSVFGALLGQIIGAFLMAIANLVLVIVKFRLPNETLSKLNEILKYGLPYALSIGVNIISNQFYNALAIRVLPFDVYGNLSAALMALAGASIISGSISFSLVPRFSKFLKNEREAFKQAFKVAIKYASQLVLPVTIIFFSLSDSFIYIFFGPRYSLAGEFLALLSLPYFLVVIGAGIIGSALLGLKKTSLVALINSLSVIISFIILLILIGDLTAFSLVLAMIINAITGTVIGLIILWRKYRIEIDILFSAKALAIAVLITITITIIKGFLFTHLLRLFVGSLLVILMFTFLLVLTKCVDVQDIARMRQLSIAVPILGRFGVKITNYMEWLYNEIYGE